MVDSMNEIQEVVHDLNLLQTKKIQTKKRSLFQLNKSNKLEEKVLVLLLKNLVPIFAKAI